MSEAGRAEARLVDGRVDWAFAVANRNFIIHQYDEINREITRQTLSVDLPAGESSLRILFADADTTLDDDAESEARTLEAPTHD